MIIGGIYVGLEFAQIFRRLGSQVSNLEAGLQLMTREDADISETARAILMGEKIEIYLNVKVNHVVQTQQEQIDIFFKQGGTDHKVRGSHLLLAVGRIPNSDRLNLDAAGVNVDDQGSIQVNQVMQTSIPHIYAVGDINGEGAFTHTAVNDGEILWDHLSGEDDRTLNLRIPTYALFIDPPLGRVGLNEKEARQSGRKIAMAV